MSLTHIKPVALAGCGLPAIGWHSFRHTVSAWSKEAGLELEDVKTLLRHEDIATTSNVYGDLGMKAKRRIRNAWSNSSGGRRPRKPQNRKQPGRKTHPLLFSDFTWPLFDPDSLCGFSRSPRKEWLLR